MIQFAEYKDIDEIMEFIDREWRRNHILARDRQFFEYMYVLDERVCFVISRNENDFSIDGILGFITYDKALKQISLTVWKALSSANGMVGMGMLNFLIKEIKPVIIASPGINPKTTIPLYKYMKFETGKMNHFYRLSKRNEYRIADIKDDCIKPRVSPDNIMIKELTSFSEFQQFEAKYEENAIKKEAWYIKRRYYKHPVYQYKVFAAEKRSDKIIMVMREQLFETNKCIRVVDIIGKYSLLPYLTEFLDKYMSINDYEYIDCYYTGIKKQIFYDAGWEDRTEHEVVIPNYFAPYEPKNIDLYYSTKPNGVAIFRGDSDQDRPN